MYKIYLPTDKKTATARGYWKSDSGKVCKDYLRIIEADKVSNKILTAYCQEYKQEAIFYEVIGKRTGRKLRAVIFYNKDKKDVLNRKRQWICIDKAELREAIKRFKKADIVNYTIEKRPAGGYTLFTWYKIRDTKPRIRRHKKLIRKLIENICHKFNKYPNIDVRYDVFGGIAGKASRYRNKLFIYTRNVRERAIYGYSNTSYYKGRGDKINPYIQHNVKKTLRFIILHELAHLLQAEDTPHIQGEIEADAFALRYLKGQKKTS